MTTFQRYASHWKALILIDEADVFLEARSSEGGGQAERNGLVAGRHAFAQPPPISSLLTIPESFSARLNTFKGSSS